MVGMDEVIYQTDIPNAIMVPVGRDVPNPLALLTNSHFAELLDMLARMADYVIVDAPRWAWSSMRQRSPRHVTAP